MIFNDPERIAALTPQNPFDRLDDGRPIVPDDLLKRLKLVTNDEAWGTLERGHNYHYVFEGGWKHLHDDVVLVGRAVTCQFVPIRPDMNDVVQGIGAKEGRDGGKNTWVIDTLRPGDVLVVDLFGKVEDGTFIGDNLGTAARARTGTGMVIDGGIQPSAGNTQRNLQGPGGVQVAYRLYADAAHTQAIGIGQAISIPVSGVASLPIYGALTLPGGAAPAGTYTDVAQVTLSY